uniref:ABC transmembrane type-1 domain-containing protein n=1 Tax=Plectus sambesii TaxID=2011161 RepID=A0A914UXJ5_9BILA
MLSPPTQLVFADKLDYRLMAVGIVFCLIQAILPPIVWLFMGQFVTNSIRREIGKCNRTVAFERWQNNDSWIVGDNTSLFRNESLANVNQTKLDQEFKENAPLVFWMMLGLSLITFAAAFLQRLTWEISAVRQVFRVKKAYISKLLHMDVAWLESRHSGEVAAMLHDHADSIYQGIADHLPMTIFIIANLIATLIVCFLTQWKTTLVMLTAIPILIITRIIFTKWFCKTLEDEQQLQGKLANLVQETFNCI